MEGLAKRQRTILIDLLTKLFDKSLEGLNRTKAEIDDLQRRHAWYHSNIYQLQQLKATIQSIQEQYDQTIGEILQQIRVERERSKEILLNALSQLETTMDSNVVRQHLTELMHEIDRLFENAGSIVSLASIFSAIGLFSLIAAIIAIFSGTSVLGVATLGLGFVAGGIGSEILFRQKLTELIAYLVRDIQNVQYQKSERLHKLNSYFNRFEQILRQQNNHNALIDLVWYDENIQSHANQSFASRLAQEFPSDRYRVMQFHDRTLAIKFIQSNIERNMILITSGSTGEAVISDIGYYWNIKGIIIYCLRVEQHRSWAEKYKKMLLITSDTNAVVQKIKAIEFGDIYFVNDGFSYEDTTLKLKNINYYLSTKEHGFIIPHLRSIKTDMNYHKDVMRRLYHAVVSKNLYPNGIPTHFELTNLHRFVEQFLQALAQTESEKRIIALYTAAAPYYYKIVNNILNRLDEELISLIGDYIKALRYALLVYVDRTNKIPNTGTVKLYRGLRLAHNNSFQEFQRKFTVNDIIIFPAFSSTSLNMAKAKSFTGGKGVLLEISADCTRLNKPKNISAESQFQYEDEVLLNCFSVLRVQSISRITENLMCYKCILELS